MADTVKLFDYLSYFEDTSQTFAEVLPKEEIEGEVIPGFIKYDNRIIDFAKEYMDLSLGKGDYTDYIQDFLVSKPSVAEWKEFIQHADLETIQSFLTYFVRKEQFKNGEMKWASENGIIYQLLSRLKEVL
ncbi:hypothetical protein JTF06_06140 [Desemzia sp. RIT804]|uniref:DUF6508 domain-containing protein n=1 Tax=Desemzia sp. RIT 804 TaxID=2810209 RepID=UPI0019519071|nr:DUF6508 domain-containing protein [Desemzia sp. RIT 804]MBM6614467.1 hypothetical protein [Desemzia sp. RIT 804]